MPLGNHHFDKLSDCLRKVSFWYEMPPKYPDWRITTCNQLIKKCHVRGWRLEISILQHEDFNKTPQWDALCRNVWIGEPCGLNVQNRCARFYIYLSKPWWIGTAPSWPLFIDVWDRFKFSKIWAVANHWWTISSCFYCLNIPHAENIIAWAYWCVFALIVHASSILNLLLAVFYYNVNWAFFKYDLTVPKLGKVWPMGPTWQHYSHRGEIEVWKISLWLTCALKNGNHPIKVGTILQASKFSNFSYQKKKKKVI